jgi:hypothetical protein
MHGFKIENFYKLHPSGTFPYFKKLDADECRGMAKRIALAIGLPDGEDTLEIVQRLAEVESEIGTLRENDLSSSLFKVIEKAKISLSELVYVNWYRFDSIDQMKYSEFLKYFDDIWYPSSDDIDIFDDTLSCIFSVTHYGAVRAAQFPVAR